MTTGAGYLNLSSGFGFWAQDAYVRAITAPYRYGWRIADPDYALSRDPDIKNKILRDAVIRSAVEKLVNDIVGRTWFLEPARPDDQMDIDAARVVEDALKNIEMFPEAMREIAKAVLYGRSYQFISGERKTIELGGLTADWWIPIKLQDVDRKRIRFTSHRDTQSRKISVIPEMWSVEREGWENIREHNHLFVKLVYNDEEDRLGHGRGMLESLFFYFRAKSVCLTEGLQGLERWAQGILVAELEDLSRPGSADDRTNEAVRDEWITMLKKHRGRHVLVHGKSDKITVHESTGSGHKIVMEMVRYLDEGMLMLINGAPKPQGAGQAKGGGFADASEQAETVEANAQSNRESVSEALTRDLVGLFWRLNQPILIGQGLGDAKMPRLRLQQRKRKDVVKNAQVIAAMLGAGVPLKAENVYEAIDMEKPGDDDDIIEGRAAMAPEPGTGGLGLLPEEKERDDSQGMKTPDRENED